MKILMKHTCRGPAQRGMKIGDLQVKIFLKIFLIIFLKILDKTQFLLKFRIYVNETIILFQHENKTHPLSPAKIVYATEQNIPDILNFQHPRYIETFKHFLSNGDKGYFAYLEEKCIHRSWVKHTPQTVHLYPVLPMKLQDDEAFIHYCETAPVARGKNIFPAVLSKIVDDLNNKRKIMIAANAKNIASIKAIKKAGFREIERHRLIVILGLKFTKILMPL